jgi:hypothetical protein
VHDRGQDLQARQAAARKCRRLVAALALIAPAANANPPAVELDTFVEVDSVPWSQASQDELSPTGDLLNTTSLSIRRGLFRTSMRRDDVHALFELDASTFGGAPNASVFEAILGWQPSELVDAQAGLMLIPFGVETPTNARYRTFMEQPWFLRAFFPGDRDTGAQVHGAYGLLRYSFAMMNGAPTKDAQWKGKDPSASYDFVARIGGELRVPTISGRPRFTAGVSLLAGRDLHPGTPPTKDQITWVDENMDGIVQPTELQVIPGTPGTASQSFAHRALGVDAKAEWCLQWAGHGEAFFEGAIATNLDRAVYYADPIANARDLRELGWMIGVVQHVTPYALAGVRYDTYDADRDSAERNGVMLVGTPRVFSTWAFLAAAQRGTTRLSVEYDHVRNPLGRDDAGNPATRADDRAVLRLQAEF